MASRRDVDDDLGPVMGGASSQRFERTLLERGASRLERCAGPIADIGAGSGHWEQLSLGPGLFVSSVNGPAGFDDRVCPMDEEFIEFQFRFEGAIKRPRAESASSDVLTVMENSLFINRQPGSRLVENKVVGGDRNAHVTIFCSPAYLTEKFGDFSANLRPRIAASLKGAADVPLACRVPLYPRLLRHAHGLARSYFTTARRLVQAEGFVLILLAEILAILEAMQDDREIPLRLSDRDFDNIHRVRDRLVRNPCAIPPIRQLAKDAGLGQTKLKAAFKALFGQSIFAFAHDLRMRHALDLLRQNELSIAQVAEAVGYEYQQSFTVAFQRHFGILPKVYRRSPVVLDQIDWDARWRAAEQGIDVDSVFGAHIRRPARH